MDDGASVILKDLVRLQKESLTSTDKLRDSVNTVVNRLELLENRLSVIENNTGELKPIREEQTRLAESAIVAEKQVEFFQNVYLRFERPLVFIVDKIESLKGFGGYMLSYSVGSIEE